MSPVESSANCHSIRVRWTLAASLFVAVLLPFVVQPGDASAAVSATQTCTPGAGLYNRVEVDLSVWVGDQEIPDGGAVEAGASLGIVVLTFGDVVGTESKSAGIAPVGDESNFLDAASTTKVETMYLTAPSTPGAYIVSGYGKGGLICSITVAARQTITVVPDSTPPFVSLIGRLNATVGATVSFIYEVSGEVGKTQELIQIRKGRKVKASVRTRPGFNDGPSIVKWKVPASLAPGRYSWCVSSADANGNVSRPICKPLVVT